MQWSRVKSILIGILLVVDAFLLMTVIGGYIVEHQKEEHKTENFISILSKKGISTGNEFILPEMMSLPMLEVDRSKNDEDAFTKGLLGDPIERQEDSEGNTIYSSSRGNVNWSTDGRVYGYFIPDEYVMPKTERDIRLMTAKLLEHCGISSSVEIEVDFEEKKATATFETAGAPVFNRFLQLSFEAEKVEVGGWWTFQTPYMVRTQNYVSCEATDSVLTLLNTEPNVGTIDGVEIGYVLLNISERRLSITPCCRITTDQGEFFVDSLKNSVIYP